jgi:hypothetical protein
VAATTVLLWAPIWDGSRTFFLQDASGYFYPMKSHLAATVRAGEWPWWNPWIRNGLPFFANPQVGVLYPPSALFYLLPTALATNWVAILHFVLLAAGIHVWLRSRGRSPTAAALGGLTVAWGGFAVSTTVYLNNLQALAWVGWTWWAWEGWLRLRSPRRLAITTALFALQFLAGEPQIVLVTAAVALLVAWSGEVPSAGARRRIAPAVGMLAVALGAAALTAVQLAPTAELFLQSGRSGGLAAGESLANSLPPSQIMNLFLPRFFDGPGGMFDFRGIAIDSHPWAFTTYLGAATVALAAAGVDPRTPRSGVLWGALAVAGVFFALGEHNPVVTGIGLERLFAPFRYPEKLLVLPALAIPVLASAGLDAAREDARARRRAVSAGGAIAVVAALVWIGGWTGALERAVRAWDPATLPGADLERIAAGIGRGAGHAAVFAALLALLVRARERLPRGSFGPLLVAAAVIDLALVHPAPESLGPARLYSATPPVLEGLGPELRTAARIRTTPLGADANGWFGLANAPLGLQQAFHFRIMSPNLSMVHQVLAQDGAEAFRPRGDDARAEILAALPVPLQVRYLRLQGTEWLLEREIEVEGLERSAAPPVDGLRRYRIVDPLPRAYLVDRVLVEPDSLAVVNAFLARGADPHRLAFVPEAPGLDGPGTRIEGAVRWQPGTNHSVSLRVRAPGRALLVLTDAWYPGWKASVDGAPAPLRRVNWHFMGVEVGPGEHDVRFDYRPRGIGAAAVVSALSLLALAGVLARGGRRGT